MGEPPPPPWLQARTRWWLGAVVERGIRPTPALDLRRLLGSCPPDTRLQWARCAACGAPVASDGLACTSEARHPTARAHVRLYATYTGTARNLAAMHAHGFRLIVGPDQLDRMPAHGPPPLAWALDNGAWAAHRAGRGFDGQAFRRALDRWSYAADWIAVPDIVAGGLASLELSLRWLPEVRATGALPLIVVQDGMEPHHLDGLLGPARAGIFVGGSTTWKLATLASWGRLAARTGCYLHVGRVNSARRIRLAASAGAHSVDGTSVSRFASNAARLAAASRELPQPQLL